MPYIGALRALGLAKETTIGTFVVPPTRFINYVPPASFSPSINLLTEKAIFSVPDRIVKTEQGVAEIKGAKLKVEVEPTNIGEIIMGAFGTDTPTQQGATAAYQHKFTRKSTETLPTYTVWMDQGATYTVLGGCMVNKLDFMIKAKELVMADVEYAGIAYEAGITETVSYSSQEPFTFAQTVIKLAGSEIDDFDSCKVSINNMVKTEHVLKSSIYPAKIYSEGMEVEVSLDIFVESGNIAQWTTSFLTGTTQTFLATITGPTAASPYNFTLKFNVPILQYKTAPFVNPAGVLKIPFAGWAVYDLASTLETIDVSLINLISTSY